MLGDGIVEEDGDIVGERGGPSKLGGETTPQRAAGGGVRSSGGVVEAGLELGVEVVVRGEELGQEARETSAASVPVPKTRMS